MDERAADQKADAQGIDKTHPKVWLFAAGLASNVFIDWMVNSQISLGRWNRPC